MHPLVEQLHFARSEFARCLEGITEDDAIKRLGPMNCISWMVGHLALQEHRYWVQMAQDQMVAADLYEIIGVNQPASTPPLAQMWELWRVTTTAADTYLTNLTSGDLTTHLVFRESPLKESVGTMIYRNIHHYWFHTGEAHGVRQQLGHGTLPQFVGAQPAFRSDGW